MNQLATRPHLQEQPATPTTPERNGIWVARDLNGLIFVYVNCPRWIGEEFVCCTSLHANYMEIDERMYPEVLPGHRLRLRSSGVIEDCRGLEE